MRHLNFTEVESVAGAGAIAAAAITPIAIGAGILVGATGTGLTIAFTPLVAYQSYQQGRGATGVLEDTAAYLTLGPLLGLSVTGPMIMSAYNW